MDRKLLTSLALAVVLGGTGCTMLGLGKPDAQVIKDPAAGLELVRVKGGCFRMGAAGEAGGPEERPAHEVCVDGFYMGRHEVTQGQWKAVMGSNPSAHQKCGDACPVEMVSWEEAQAFVARLNAAGPGPGFPAGQYRLPTEAEWEYAARSGGKDEKFAGTSDDLGSVAWFLESAEEPHPVGLKAPNGLGLHDMTGNVWEWTADWYGEAYYAASPRANPTGPATGARRVLRGGSYASGAFDARTTFRNSLPPASRGDAKGFRVIFAAPLPSPAVAVAVAAEVAAQAPAVPAEAPVPPVKEPLSELELRFVKGGCFQMGDIYGDGVAGSGDGANELPVHEVCVGDFYLGTYEVTRGQWKAVMGKDPSSSSICPQASCPVDNVSWKDVQEFIRRVNAKDGKARYRLPTEAEWEYAARSGGKAERYAGGDDVDEVSWYAGNSGYLEDPAQPIAHPAGTKAPNGLGLYNMSGNVYELTSDWYDETYYSKSPRDNPPGPATGEFRVKRGGCASGHPGNSRTARRALFDAPDSLTGLRLLRSP